MIICLLLLVVCCLLSVGTQTMAWHGTAWHGTDKHKKAAFRCRKAAFFVLLADIMAP